MRKIYINIKLKIEELERGQNFGVKINFYKLILGLLKYFIVLFGSSAFSFSLIFQNQGAQSVRHSYKDFKKYQREARILFLSLIILALLALKT